MTSLPAPGVLRCAWRWPCPRRRRRPRSPSRNSPVACRPSSSASAPRPRPATDDGNGLADLDQRLRVIERKLELQAEEAAAKAASTPTVTLSASKGLSVKSPPPGDIEVKFKALVQADGRFYFDDDSNPQNDTFLFRRVEPTIEGTLGLADRRSASPRSWPATAPPSTTPTSTCSSIRARPCASARPRCPVGLERLQSSSATVAWSNAASPASSRPVRDIGVQLQGELAGSDGQLRARRLQRRARWPRRCQHQSRQRLRSRRARVRRAVEERRQRAVGPGLRHRRQQRRQAKAAATTSCRATARRARCSSSTIAAPSPPMASTRAGRRRRTTTATRSACFGEYISSSQEVPLPATGAARDARQHAPGSSRASYVLTGEDASYRGVTRPNHPFTVGSAGWGAWELVARYGELEIDDDAFPLFADPAVVAQRRPRLGAWA